MRWYTLPGWPSRVAGRMAAMPTPTHSAGDSRLAYKGQVTGHPGTVQAPVGGPGVPAGPVAQAMGGSSYSAYCPGFFPNLYWAGPEPSYWPGAGMPISVQSDNLMPVPASDPRGVAAPLQTPLSLRGAKQIRQPASLVQWPSVNG